jgi:hypothetical protein
MFARDDNPVRSSTLTAANVAGGAIGNCSCREVRAAICPCVWEKGRAGRVLTTRPARTSRLCVRSGTGLCPARAGQSSGPETECCGGGKVPQKFPRFGSGFAERALPAARKKRRDVLAVGTPTRAHAKAACAGDSGYRGLFLFRTRSQRYLFNAPGSPYRGHRSY